MSIAKVQPLQENGGNDNKTVIPDQQPTIQSKLVARHQERRQGLVG
eukprot:CAMPEP_0197552594 /NCGR_PEP_ID=MMETSP1320-20131121/6260_1 /TAXON_ID=91990 /ORGANISM="Bolidomonas sp., Strain RCC2347" /LENGTH=45 /DNA_ID= /DNA_START= /DNA_END= /DNA_ORIENTATION=